MSDARYFARSEKPLTPPGWQLECRPCPVCFRRLLAGTVVHDPVRGRTGVVQRDGFTLATVRSGIAFVHVATVAWNDDNAVVLAWPKACGLQVAKP